MRANDAKPPESPFSALLSDGADNAPRPPETNRQPAPPRRTPNEAPQPPERHGANEAERPADSTPEPASTEGNAEGVEVEQQEDPQTDLSLPTGNTGDAVLVMDQVDMAPATPAEKTIEATVVPVATPPALPIETAAEVAAGIETIPQSPVTPTDSAPAQPGVQHEEPVVPHEQAGAQPEQIGAGAPRQAAAVPAPPAAEIAVTARAPAGQPAKPAAPMGSPRTPPTETPTPLAPTTDAQQSAAADVPPDQAEAQTQAPIQRSETAVRPNVAFAGRADTPEAGRRPVTGTSLSDVIQLARSQSDTNQMQAVQTPRDLGHVMAATAQTASAPAAASTAPVPIEGLAVEIAARVQAGRNRFEIRLDPPELGRIEVRLDIDRGGHVTSRLVVERAETLDVLRRDAHELERALNQAGLKTGDNGLQFALRDQAFADRDQGRSSNSAQVVVAEQDLPAVQGLSGHYSRMLTAHGGIDIRV